MAAQTIYQGDLVELPYTIKLNGSAQNISTWTGSEISYRVGIDGNEDMIEYTIGSGITLTDGANGIITVTLAAADTGALAPGTYSHELKIAKSGTATRTLFRDPLRILNALHTED